MLRSKKRFACLAPQRQGKKKRSAASGESQSQDEHGEIGKRDSFRYYWAIILTSSNLVVRTPILLALPKARQSALLLGLPRFCSFLCCVALRASSALLCLRGARQCRQRSEQKKRRGALAPPSARFASLLLGMANLFCSVLAQQHCLAAGGKARFASAARAELGSEAEARRGLRRICSLRNAGTQNRAKKKRSASLASRASAARRQSERDRV